MSVYLDANVIISAFVTDALSSRTISFLRNNPSDMIVSDFAAAEFSSVIGRLVRTGGLDKATAQTVFANFDGWTTKETMRVKAATTDIEDAESFLRRLDLPLRTPDAINVAIARRLGAELATFDKQMAVAARTLGIPIAKA